MPEHIVILSEFKQVMLIIWLQVPTYAVWEELGDRFRLISPICGLCIPGAE